MKKRSKKLLLPRSGRRRAPNKQKFFGSFFQKRTAFFLHPIALEKAGVIIDPMKLQKLIYLAHGYYFAVTGCPLVGEQFEAWQFGPVSPTIYHEFNRFSSSALKKGVRATRTVFCDDGSVEYVEPLFPGEAPPKVSGKKEKHVLIKMQQNMNTRCAPLSWDLLEDGFVATHLRRFLRQCFAFLEASYLPVLHWPEAWSILIKIKV